MADTDGKIKLAVDLSPEEARKSAQKLQKSIQNIFNQTSGQKLDSQFQKMLSSMSKAVTKSENLQKSLEKVSNQQIPTQEYKNLEKILQQNEKTLERLNERQYQMEELGKENSAAYQKLQADIKQTEVNISAAKGEMALLVSEGKAFTLNEIGIESAKNALADSNNELRMMIESAAQYKNVQSEISQQHSAEIDAQAQEIAKLLEIKLNAGEINDEIAGTIDKLRNVNSELERLYARQSELEAAGVGLGYEEYDRNLAKIRQLEEAQSRLNQRVAEYREAQENATEPVTVWSRTGDLFRQIGQDLLHPIQRFRELREQTENAGDSADRTHPRFRRLLSTLGRLAGSFITSVSGINRFKNALSGAANKAHSSAMSFRRLFSALVFSGIGAQSIYSLFGKIKSAITENIKYYALMNNGMNQTNYAISALQSSLNALKGALAGAFVPIITTVSPILSSLIDQLASVITAIGMFIAKLTGAKSYLRAVKTSTNYASGLSSGGGSSSSKKSAQEKYEEAVAKANKKYEEQVSKTAEKNAKAQAKAEEQQAKAAAKLAKQQEKANNQLATYDKLNVINKEDLEELEDIQADVYEDPELELPDISDYQDALSGGGGSSNPFGFEEVPLDDIEWNWDDLKAKAEQLGRDLANKLNDFFKNEDFAKDIGHNIAEALNTALHFAYGFIDELDWRQMGRWLGTLVQEGLETFEWDLLGKTIGEFLNGIADSIIGFFERYEAGTLGSSLATMFNNAIDTIDPVKLGIAVSEVLKDPFIELSSFLTESNWNEAGRKFGIFLHNALTSRELNGLTLGETVGKTLADAVNAGIDLLLGADIRTAVADLTTFFGDIIRKALVGIDWPGLFEAIWHVIIGTLSGFLQGVITFLIDLIFDLIEKAVPSLTGKIEAAREEVHAQIEEAFADTEQILTGFGDTAEEQADRFSHAMADMADAMIQWYDGGSVNWLERLQEIQTQYQLTDEDMDTLISKFSAVDDTFNTSADILSGYTGNWAEYKATMEGTSPAIDTAKAKQEELNGAVEGVGITAEETGNKVKDYVKIASDEMESGKANAEEYESSVNSNLQGISDKSSEVELNFTTMTEQINAELEGLTLLVDEWYQNLLAQYFSYDNWYAMLQQGILMAFNNFLTIDLFNNWDVNMKVWWETKVKPYFSAEKWNNEIFTPWRANKDARWNELMSWFDTQINDWWNNKVKPMFEQSKWSEQFNNVKSAAEETFSAVEETIVDHINNAKEAVLQACEEMQAAIAAVKAEMASIGMGGGGGRSSGYSSGGWKSAVTGGSGGRFSSFMPMANIMNFEDNLGMSAFKFPELATGAVIPPNNKFLAVLGDQRSGTNIETPLNTMIEAFNRALDQRDGSNREPIILQLNSEVIAEAVWDEEEKKYKQQGDYESLYD